AMTASMTERHLSKFVWVISSMYLSNSDHLSLPPSKVYVHLPSRPCTRAVIPTWLSADLMLSSGKVCSGKICWNLTRSMPMRAPNGVFSAPLGGKGDATRGADGSGRRAGGGSPAPESCAPGQPDTPISAAASAQPREVVRVMKVGYDAGGGLARTPLSPGAGERDVMHVRLTLRDLDEGVRLYMHVRRRPPGLVGPVDHDGVHLARGTEPERQECVCLRVAVSVAPQHLLVLRVPGRRDLHPRADTGAVRRPSPLPDQPDARPVCVLADVVPVHVH